MNFAAFADDLTSDSVPESSHANSPASLTGASRSLQLATPEALPSRPFGGAYSASRPRWTVLAVIIAFHVLAIGVLATARFVADRREQVQRVTTFAVSEPPPPPEAAEQPQPQQQVASPLVAPEPPIDLPRPAPVQAAPLRAEITLATPASAPVNPPAPTAPPAPAAPAPIVPPDFRAAQLNNPGPAYPYLSRKAREEGVVMLKVLVSADGRAKQLQVDRSSGSERLDDAALKTVRKWRFVPASQAGQPREAWVLVPVTFALN